MAGVNVYLASVEPALERIKNKIKRESLKFLGFEMNYGLLNKILYVLGAIISGIV
jgi:hypothetical protein